MTSKTTQATALGFAATGLLCWILMFGAATDLWHETGRVDLGSVPGVHAVDLGTFVITFYGLFFILLAQFVVMVIIVVRGRRIEAKHGDDLASRPLMN